MSIPRIYQDQELQTGRCIELDLRAQHHIINVLRLREGIDLLIFNGHSQYKAILKRSGKKAYADILDSQAIISSPLLPLKLTQSISRGDRMDTSIQKAVELGVTAIQPLFSERSIKISGDRIAKKMNHWQGIIISACEQSGRCQLPLLYEPESLNNYLTSRNNDFKGFVLQPNAKSALAGALVHDTATEILIGPEGGLSEAETKAAEAAKFTAVHLGPRILRTETAGITALSICQSIIGVLKNNS